MSTIEVLASEAVRVLGPTLADAVGTGVRQMIGRLLKRGSRFPDDPADREAFLTRMLTEDPELVPILERLLVAHRAGPPEVTAPPGFVDRAEIRERLARPGIWLVVGAHEEGKTALTAQVAHDLRAELDGYAPIDLDAYRDGPVLRVTEVQQQVLRALKVPEVADTAPEVDRQYRQAPHNRRCLLVFDNLAGAEEAEALVHGWDAATVLITTRRLGPDLRAWYAGRPETLPDIDAAGAEQILAARCGAEMLAAEPAAVRELIRLCAASPALLSQIGGRLAIFGGGPGAVAEELRWLRTDPGVEALLTNSVGRSVGLLDAASLAGLALLAGHPGADLSDAGASAWLGRDCRAPVADLIGAALMTRDRSGRLRLPWSVRRYAQEALRPSAEMSDAAFARYLTWFRDLAGAADLAMDPAGVVDRAREGRLRRYPAPPVIDWAYPDIRPVDRLAAEAHVVEDLLREAHHRGHHVEVVQICGALEALLTLRGHHRLCARANEWGLRSATALGWTAAVVRLRMLQGRILTLLGLLDAAGQQLAAAGAPDLDDPQLESSLLEFRARWEQERGGLPEAEVLLRRSLEIDRSIGDQRGYGLHRRMLANVLIEAGRGREALALLVDVVAPAGDTRNAARLCMVRAKARIALGEGAEAAGELAQARDLVGRSGADQYDAELDDLRAQAALLDGDTETARRCWLRVAAHYLGSGHPREQRILNRLAALPRES